MGAYKFLRQAFILAVLLLYSPLLLLGQNLSDGRIVKLNGAIAEVELTFGGGDSLGMVGISINNGKILLKDMAYSGGRSFFRVNTENDENYPSPYYFVRNNDLQNNLVLKYFGIDTSKDFSITVLLISPNAKDIEITLSGKITQTVRVGFQEKKLVIN